MTLKERIKSFDESKLNLFLLSCIALGVFILTIPFFFLGFPGIPLGWLLGSAIEIFNYATIVLGAKLIISPQVDKPIKGAIYMIFTTLLRIAFWVGGLALAGYITFRLESQWLNFWATFAGYVPLTGVVVVSMILKNKKKKEGE